MPVKLNKARIKRQVRKLEATGVKQPTETIDYVSNMDITVTDVPCFHDDDNLFGDVLLSGHVLEQVYRCLKKAEETEQVVIPFKKKRNP